MAQEQAPDPISSLLAEFGTRLNEVEEKQRLIRDRSLLIGENLITSKQESEDQDYQVKKDINKINSEIKEIKQLVKRIVNELGNLSRKSEVEILKNQFKMFEPLKFARIKDIEQMISKALDKKS